MWNPNGDVSDHYRKLDGCGGSSLIVRVDAKNGQVMDLLGLLCNGFDSKTATTHLDESTPIGLYCHRFWAGRMNLTFWGMWVHLKENYAATSIEGNGENHHVQSGKTDSLQLHNQKSKVIRTRQPRKLNYLQQWKLAQVKLQINTFARIATVPENADALLCVSAIYVPPKGVNRQTLNQRTALVNLGSDKGFCYWPQNEEPERDPEISSVVENTGKTKDNAKWVLKRSTKTI